MGYKIEERKDTVSAPPRYDYRSKTPSPETPQRQFQARRRSSLRQCITPTELQENGYEDVFDDDEKEVIKDQTPPKTPHKTACPSPRTSFAQHRESLVGSYEESLLSGRMSASTSKTVAFHAAVGVLGTGSCSKVLRCPKQINMSFSAGFVVWEDMANTASLVSATGSPYVCIVSLTDYYQRLFVKRDKRTQAIQRTDKERARTKTFAGYRIPPVGQIQIVVSNLQKTAVKLFLIPYNLADMPKGTKTFIRQKVYAPSDTPGSKGTLVHAAHVPITKLENEKLYLSGDIRLVFQNRVLNGGAGDDRQKGVEDSSNDNSAFAKHYLGLGRSKDNMRIEEVLGGWS